MTYPRFFGQRRTSLPPCVDCRTNHCDCVSICRSPGLALLFKDKEVEKLGEERGTEVAGTLGQDFLAVYAPFLDDAKISFCIVNKPFLQDAKRSSKISASDPRRYRCLGGAGAKLESRRFAFYRL